MITAARGVVVAVGQVWKTRRGARRRVVWISDDEAAIGLAPHCATHGRMRTVRPAWFRTSATFCDGEGSVHRETIDENPREDAGIASAAANGAAGSQAAAVAIRPPDAGSSNCAPSPPGTVAGGGG